MTEFISEASQSSPSNHLGNIVFLDDILIRIISYLNPSDMLRMSETSYKIYRLQSHPECERIWLSHALKIWDQICYNRPIMSNNEDTEINLMNRIKKLSLQSLRKSLSDVDVSRCIEKSDYRNMLMAHLVFKSIYVKTYSLCSHSIRSGRGILYPTHCLSINPCKASFYFAKAEIHRFEIYQSELCLIQWRIYFKNMGPTENWESRFMNDFTMTSGLHAEVLPWQFVMCNDDVRRIQVEQYPPLTSSRMSNGRWRLENSYVFFLQKNTINGEDLPLF